MAPVSPFVVALGAIALGARSILADCASYGMDFQNGGQYFQNSLSNDSFTFVSEFEGCQNDTAFNILVYPNADQVLCSDTNLQPDLQDMLSTCPVTKNELYSGPWSIIVMSNNGKPADIEPIAFQRDFSLSVGPQSTSTVTPTVTVIATYTPLVNTTITTTSTVNTTLAQKTVTSPSVTVTQTKTIIPDRVTTTSTKAIFTVRSTEYSLDLNVATKTETAKCRLPTKPAKRDPVCKIRPTVGPVALRGSVAHKFRRGMPLNDEEKRQFIEARDERLFLVERAPDPQPLLITDTDTAHWSTATSTTVAPAVTATLTTQAYITSTVTLAPLTVLKGKTTAPRVTVTAPARTRTVICHTVARTTTTKVVMKDFTITRTVTPASVKTACRSAGGVLY